MSRQRNRNRFTAATVLVVGVAVFFLAAPATRAATVDVGDGLVGHWSFNESSGSVADNGAALSTALDGTLVGDAAFVGGGMFGNAVELGGIDGYVDIIHRVIPDQAPEYTYSAWFKSATSSGQQYVLETATGGSAFALSARRTNTNIDVFASTIGTGGGTEIVPSFSIASTINDWNLLTVTYKEGMATRAHINGSIVSQDTALGAELISTDGLHIGADRNSGRTWDGLIDDVGVWSRVLNGDEIAHLYNGGTGNEIVASPMTVDVADGLVGYWPMDEPSGNTALNAASTGPTLDGSLVGDPARVVGKVGSGALQFDGIDDYVDVVNEVIPDGQDSYTAVAWINPAAGGPSRQAIFETSGSWAVSTELSQDNLRIKYSVETDGTGVVKESDVDPVEGQWHHLALVYDEPNNVTKLYVNGDEELDYRGSPGGNLRPSDGFHIATYRGANGRWFKGTMDEVAVWDRPLNDAEIAHLWNDGAGIAVPEPASLLLAGWSLLALAAFSRRNRSGS